MARSLPGADGGPPASERDAAEDLDIDLSGTLETYDGVPSGLPGAWPRFRGADFDNISKGNVKLADSWPESGPEVLWSVELGEGHAAPVVFNGRVYLLDYDEGKRADALRFTWREASGSLGDLGTFLPLVVAMSVTCGLDLGIILIFAG